jgi:pimeloyl-ACP methyl ester carboxylesterase
MRSLAAGSIAVFSIAAAQPRITVTSKDGVPISAIKIGSGPPMVMVHGSASVALSWAAVLPELSKRFTLYVMDRRGRLPSGDAKEYSVNAEVDDIAAVIGAAGGPVTLVAHSYGAFLATIGATQKDALGDVSRMILYEPPAYDRPRAERIEEIRQAAQAGDRDRIASVFLENVVGSEPLKNLRASQGWAGILSIADTIPREVQTVNDVRVSLQALGRWRTPTTMFVGERSPELLRDAAKSVCSAMANCRLVTLEGQGHIAAQQAPGLFVEKVLEATEK